jgi:sugar phosphate isomerase/epimerase
VVIHLIQPYDIPHGEVRDRMIEAGRRSVAALANYAGRRGVKMAFENGQRQDYDDVLASLLAEFTGAHIGFCYDSGHEHVQGSGFRMLKTFGHRLFTTHIHDNKGTDTHVLPHEGTIDWEQFRTVFHGLGYTGNLLLETEIANSEFKAPSLFLSRARECAERLLRSGSKASQ